MNRRILIVGPSAVSAVAKMLDEAYDLTTVISAGEAVGASEMKGPFATVLAASEIHAERGIEVLGRFEKKWPDTTRILLTERARPESAIEVLRSESIFRLLMQPFEAEELQACVQAGVEKFHARAQERLLTEQLQFSRESLLSLTETLENRLAAQLGRLHGMQRFAGELKETRSLEEVARLTADTASRLLDGRSVEVAFDGTIHREAIHVLCGHPMREDVETVPVLTTDGALGHLRIEARRRRRPLTDADREILASLTASAAIAARNQIHIGERNSAQHATIFALARLAEYRDDETGRHLERVTAYCRLVAEGLRDDGKFLETLTDAFVRDLELSAPLHDIGKVGVPDSILHKAGPLDDDQWEVMRKHSTIGAETLRSVLETSGERSFLRMGYEIALYHHERWSGEGYPEGLRREEIPLAARIMAIADCYDALTTRRPYKEAWSHHEAMNYILEQRGLHFDPDVVDAFDARSERVDEIRGFLADEADGTPRRFPNVA